MSDGSQNECEIDFIRFIQDRIYKLLIYKYYGHTNLKYLKQRKTRHMTCEKYIIILLKIRTIRLKYY